MNTLLKTLSYFLLTFFSSSVILPVFSQEYTSIIPDSLKYISSEELIERIKVSTPKEASFYEKALAYNMDKDSSIAKEYYRIAFHFYDNEQDYRRAISYFNKAIEIAKKPKDTRILDVIYLNIGNAYKLSGEDAQALDAYYTFLKTAQKNKNIDHELVAHANIAVIYRRMEQYKEALQKSLLALRLIDKTPYKNKRNHVNTLTVISETYLDLKEYDSVLHYANKGLKISDSLDYKLGTADLWIKKGIVFAQKKNCDQAFDYFFNAKNLLESNEIKNSFLQKTAANYFIADCLYKDKKYDEAIRFLQNNIKIVEEENLKKVHISYTSLLLAKAYKETNQIEKSIYWFDEYTSINDKLKENKNHIVPRIYEKETQEFKSEITALKLEKKQNAETTKYIILLLVIISIALFIILFTYFKKQSSNKALFKNLVNQISDLESQRKANLKPIKETSKEIRISDKKLQKILKGLDKLEEQEFFLRPDCNLRTIAKKLKTNVTYLSKIINTHKEKSFHDYINDLRIEYALKRLKDDKQFRSFSIKSIASELGYKCDHSFAKHFKSKTDLYPSYYIKQLDKLNTIATTPKKAG